MSNLIITIPCLFYVVHVALFGEAKAGIEEPPPPDPTTTPSTTPTTPIPETTAASTTTHTTAAPPPNQELEIIIGVSVSVFGLIFLLATVGFVSKLIKYKKRPKQYQDARDSFRF